MFKIKRNFLLFFISISIPSILLIGKSYKDLNSYSLDILKERAKLYYALLNQQIDSLQLTANDSLPEDKLLAKEHYVDIDNVEHFEVVLLKDTQNVSPSKRKVELLYKELKTHPNYHVLISLNKKHTISNTDYIILWGVLVIIVLFGGFVVIYKFNDSHHSFSKKRSDFISAVSHEFKTPLTSIQMYTELLEQGWITDEEKKNHYYNLISTETQRLSRLIQNILTLSNFEHNQWPIQPELLNPKELLEEFISKYQGTVENRGFKLNLKISECKYKFLIDKDAFFQILLNLIENAMKFSINNCEKQELDISLKTNYDNVYLSIRDYGPGVPQNEINKIFEDFYRIENEMTRKTTGTGIGLSLVRHLTKAMDMQVHPENANPGLRFNILMSYNDI